MPKLAGGLYTAATRSNGYAYKIDGNKTTTDNNGSSYGNTYTAGDIIGIALDLDNNQIFFYKNGTIQNSGTAAFTSITALDNGTADTSQHFVFGADTDPQNDFTFNFGQDSTFHAAVSAGGNADADGRGDFKYTVPTGYLAVCAANLPEPTIGPNSNTQADDHFNTAIWTGNATNRSITGIGFQPDWVWTKKRSAVQNHCVTDSSRGIGNILFPDVNDAESATQLLTSFDSDGFSINTNALVNENTATYVAWNWKANGGTTSSNSDGSITSTVQANTTAGFSISLYTGNATAGATVGHGLGVAPSFVIVKTRSLSSASSWLVGHDGIASDAWTDGLFLDVSDAASDSANFWNDTAPSSSVVTLGGAYNPVNGNNATYVMYAFANVEGYSKFGSYSGNGNNDGSFIYTGFRPAWVLIKKSGSGTAAHWRLTDTARSPFNVTDAALSPSINSAEFSENDMDILSNGFKLRQSNTYVSQDGVTFIYMAFAEAPFKYSNAR